MLKFHPSAGHLLHAPACQGAGGHPPIVHVPDDPSVFAHDTKSGERVDNVTDWAVKQFEARYGAPLPLPAPLPAREGLGVGASAQHERPKAGAVSNTASSASPSPPTPDPSLKGRGGDAAKDAIFAYCYAALHDPVYRDAYALNLNREFPRVPLHDDFARWVGWGRRLLDLHIGYEDVVPLPLTLVDLPNPKRAAGSHPRPKLKSLPERGRVVVDEDTVLDGIPAAAGAIG